MKKIILSSIVLLTLTSCGTVVKIESPESAINKNQVSFIENMENLISYSPKEWVSEWNIDFWIESKEWKVNWEINYNINFIQSWQEFDWIIDIKLNAEVEDNAIIPINKLNT